MSSEKNQIKKVAVKLGKRPEVFKPITVEFEMVAGADAGDVGFVPDVVFKYRTRTEFGELVNQMHADAGERAPGVRDDGTVDFKELHAKLGKKGAEHLLRSIDSWGLDEPLTLDSLVALCDAYPGAAAKLMQVYSRACTEGRLGN